MSESLKARISKSYLSHSEWDTRLAAADSIESIIDKLVLPKTVQAAGNEVWNESCLTFDNFSLENVLRTGTPLLACKSDDFDESDDDHDNLNTEDYIRSRREKLDAQMGLSQMKGVIDSKDLYTDEDIASKRIKREGQSPPAKKIKIQRQESNVDNSELEWKSIFDSPPSLDSEDSNWSLKWFYTRIRLGLGSQVWEQRHGAACAIRALLRKQLKIHPEATERKKWLVDISLRLITVLALDRFGDFVSDSVVAPIRETAAQGLGIAAQLLEKSEVQKIIDNLTYLVQFGTTTRSSCQSDADMWPIRQGGLLGLKWIFAVNKPLLEFNFTSLYSILCSSLSDRSDDCRQVAVAILLPISEFICNDHLFRGIEIALLAWKLIKGGDDLTASTGSIINLLSELMQFGKDELIFSVVGSDAALILPSLLPLMLHSLRNVREAAIESISSILECTGTHNLDAVLQDTLNRTFYMTLIENPSSKMSTVAQTTWCLAIKMCSPKLLISICEANLSLWILLTNSPDNNPLDCSLVSMLRDQSPTDQLFWMGGATESDRTEVYPQTRYILCHLLSEIFCCLGDRIYYELDQLLQSDEGYKRLVGIEIIFLMKRKNVDVTHFLNNVQLIHSKG